MKTYVVSGDLCIPALRYVVADSPDEAIALAESDSYDLETRGEQSQSSFKADGVEKDDSVVEND